MTSPGIEVSQRVQSRSFETWAICVNNYTLAFMDEFEKANIDIQADACVRKSGLYPH